MERSQSLQRQCAGFAWFLDSQLQSVIRNGVVPEWFHGIISRKRAEELLTSRPPGFFLIRVSESRIGYTLSYRGKDSCRHFKIGASEDGHYVIVGDDRRHRFLQDLVDHHRRTPIIPFMEVLTVACGQDHSWPKCESIGDLTKSSREPLNIYESLSNGNMDRGTFEYPPCMQHSNDKMDTSGILFPQKHLNHDASLQPNNLLLLRASHQVSQEDNPPALPHRPNNLVNSAVLSPNSQSNRQSFTLGGEYGMVTALLPAMPVPKPKKRYAVDNPPSNWPPEVSAQSSGPPLKQNQAFVKTVSAPESSSSPIASEHPLCANIQPVKSQEAKPSFFSDMKNLKKTLQKQTSMSQEFTYTENNVKATDKAGEQTYSSQFPCTDATDGGLPEEYNPPPPFAPGFTTAPFENNGMVSGLGND